MAADSKAKAGGKPDLASLGGLLLAIGGIVGGFLLEGGSVAKMLAPTAGMIVLGGTLGAVMITTPLGVLIRAVKAMGSVFFEKAQPVRAMIDQIVEYATKARKNGIVSLEEEAAALQDPFLGKALTLAVDGTDLDELRKMMELEIEVEEHQVEAEAKVFEAAGGYSPTIGIIGAVLGLIQTMQNLADIEEVGKGIATAFVATIYGVGAANIFFLPAGGKIRARGQERTRLKEMMLEGVVSIVEGMNPKLIRGKLEAYAHLELAKPEKAGTGASAEAEK